jgi:hypothetical protein
VELLIPEIVGSEESVAFPEIEVLKILLTLAPVDATIISHLNSEPPSVGKTVTSVLVDPTNLAGEVQAV